MRLDSSFGLINEHAAGIVMKELVRRVIQTVRRERYAFEAKTKTSYAGELDADVFTNVDVMAQEIYLKGLQECFPECGIIGEEDDLHVKSKNGYYFTIDPIDGTKAFIRQQSHGISTMLSLVYKGSVISAWIGDINTEEIFGYRPGSNKVWRITKLETFQQLPHFQKRRTKESYALLRDPEPMYSKPSQEFLKDFKNHEVMGSSIGTWAARLWKGEVQALMLREGWETPWDSCPVIGISKALGYFFYRPNSEGVFSVFHVDVPLEKSHRNHDLVIM